MKLSVLVFLLIILSGATERQSVLKPSVCVSPEEKKLYEMILEYRKSKKLGPIPLSSKLTLVAQTHAHDLVDSYKFDPNNKCNLHSWSKKGKWTSCCYTPDHKQAKCIWDKPKEIAAYNSPGYEIAYYNSEGANAQEALDGWKLSTAHNPLLINDGMWSKVEWKAIGIGIYQEYGIVWFGQASDDETPEWCP